MTALSLNNLYGSTQVNEKSILGVYKLTKFVTLSSEGKETPWCVGATGNIAYVPGYVHVGINCESAVAGSNADELGAKLFYSGPFEVDTKTQEVIHRVRNYSHPSLHKVLRRKVVLKNKHLSLSGDMADGSKIIIEWEKTESFKYDNSALTGVYELVGSENQVEGQEASVPFCNGFYGTILYTPGGFGAVSINCGEPLNTTVSEPADIFERRYFYSGSYKQEDKILIQSIEHSTAEKQIGGEARREMTMKNDLLILKGENGSKFVATWRKLKSFIGLK